MKRVLVVGKGLSGSSAKRFLETKGFDVIFENTSKIPPLGVFEFAVVSPGIDRNHPYIQAIEKKMEVINDVELAFRYASCRIIGVTGTNGKSSMVTYLGKMFDAKVCGNIGVPACDVLPFVDKDGWAIVELSSFQLERISTRCLEVAVLLKVTEDHLDRYNSFEEYKATKHLIKHLVVPGGKFYVEKEGDFLPGKFFLSPAMEILRQIEHEVGGSIEKADKTFVPLEHRLELFFEKDDLKVINDSKATTPASTEYALSKVKGSIILLLGGRDKESDFDPLGQVIGENVKAVICFGEAAEKIKKSLQSNCVVYTVEKMDHAILKGLSLTTKGDTLLFSPACTSFDEFSNFAERGKVFKQRVLDWKG